MEKISFFSADFRDGRIRIGNKTYPAGTFATHLLNQYYKDDTAARLAIYKQYSCIYTIRSLPVILITMMFYDPGGRSTKS